MQDLTDEQTAFVGKLRERYDAVPEVLFRRSVAHAKNEVELFDILDTIPDGLPVVWDPAAHRWKRLVEPLGGGV